MVAKHFTDLLAHKYKKYHQHTHLCATAKSPVHHIVDGGELLLLRLEILRTHHFDDHLGMYMEMQSVSNTLNVPLNSIVHNKHAF